MKQEKSRGFQGDPSGKHCMTVIHVKEYFSHDQSFENAFSAHRYHLEHSRIRVRYNPGIYPFVSEFPKLNCFV